MKSTIDLTVSQSQHGPFSAASIVDFTSEKVKIPQWVGGSLRADSTDPFQENLSEKKSVVCLFSICFEWAAGFLATESKFKPTVHAASRHGTPSLTSLPKDDEVSCEVRPPRSPIRSLTSLDQA